MIFNIIIYLSKSEIKMWIEYIPYKSTETRIVVNELNKIVELINKYKFTYIYSSFIISFLNQFW